MKDEPKTIDTTNPRAESELSASSCYLAIEQSPQSQESLTDQALELIPVANKLGLYDVADFLKDKFQRR